MMNVQYINWMISNISGKIGEQQRCYEHVSSEETKEIIKHRITQLEVEREMWIRLLNNANEQYKF